MEALHDRIYELEPPLQSLETTEVLESVYDSHVWLLYGELLSIVEEEESQRIEELEKPAWDREERDAYAREIIRRKTSAIHTAVINHCIGVGDSLTAERLIDGLVVDDDSVPGGRRLDLEYTDKLSIFSRAAELEEAGVIMSLGDLRAEAETRSAADLGRYICEELKQGWAISNNVDELMVIVGHGEGKSIKREAEKTIDLLLARLWIADKNDPEIEMTMARAEEAGLIINEQTIMVMRAIEGEVRLKDLVIDRGERKEYKQNGMVSVGYGSNHKVYRGLLLLALGEAQEQYERSSGNFNSSFLDGISAELRAADPGLQAIVEHYFPEVVSALEQIENQSLIKWHQELVAPDAKIDSIDRGYSNSRVIPQNLSILREWLKNQQSGNFIVNSGSDIIIRISRMAVRGLESPADHDDKLAADLLAELEVITTVTESIEPTLMKTDMVDRLRFQAAANKPFAQIFERAEGLVGGAQRLEVMYLVFCKQRTHDDASGDTTIDSMRAKVTGVAEACLMNPIDRIALGEDYIQEILEDVSLEP